MFTTNARNLMLDALDIGFASLHSAFPGQSSSSEITGGSPAYARKAVTLGAAANGQRLTSNSPQFDVPAAGVVAWIGFQTLATAGNCRGVSPNGAQPKHYAVSLQTANTIASVAHGYVLNTPIVFYGGTPPGGLSEGVTYYVIAPATDTFQVAASPSGAALPLSGQPSQDCLLSKIVTETFAAQGTFTLNSGAILSLNF